jgi:putative membrane protein
MHLTCAGLSTLPRDRLSRATGPALAAGWWLLYPGIAWACAEHAGSVPPHDVRSLHAWWSWDPLSLTLLALSGSVHITGVTRLYRHAGIGHGLRRFELAAFWFGWLSLAAALLSPLDTLSDILFSAHMTQHELLMLVAAPAMVVGRPWIALGWALPAGWRAPLLGWFRRPSPQRVWRLLTAPLVALTLHAVALWIWHMPRLFDAALQDEAMHAVQHACFFFTAALFFFSLTQGRYGRIGYGAAAFFVFLTAAHSGLLGALLALASGLWYPLQAERGAPYGVCALEDQQLAGLIMWVPAGTVLALIALALFAAWLGESERRALLAERRPRHN